MPDPTPASSVAAWAKDAAKARKGRHGILELHPEIMDYVDAFLALPMHQRHSRERFVIEVLQPKFPGLTVSNGKRIIGERDRAKGRA